MKKLKSRKRKNQSISEDCVYSHLARQGDPSAYFALFYQHIRSLYLMLRARGLAHGDACVKASAVVVTAYKKYIKSRPRDSHKWFVAQCRLKKFDVEAAALDAPAGELAEFEKNALGALNRAYTERLERGSNGKGAFRSEHPLFPYIASLASAAVIIALLFISQPIVTVSFGRSGKEYAVSFPNIADKLWNFSGLVHFMGNRDVGAPHTDRDEDDR